MPCRQEVGEKRDKKGMKYEQGRCYTEGVRENHAYFCRKEEKNEEAQAA